MIDIILHPDEVWPYFMENMDALEASTELIAENQDTNTQVFITSYNGVLTLQITIDDEIQDELSYDNEIDCEGGVYDTYDFYIYYEKKKKSEAEADEEIAQMIEDIDEREQELVSLSEEFLEGVAPNLLELAKDDYDKILSEVVDMICEYLWIEHGISVYRPMLLKDEYYPEGYYTKYPYPEIDFDNEE